MSRPPLLTAKLGQRLERGVHIAPWMGPNGEFELLAVTSDRRLLTGVPVRIPLGSDYGTKGDELWDMLDEFDPPTPKRPPLRAI